MNKSQYQLIGSTEYIGFSNCDYFIEAVFEDLLTKQEVIADVEAVSPNAIIASNTSSISIEQIAQKASKPENIIGLHYFSPVEKMPLVEVIPHENTSKETLNTIHLALKQGKTRLLSVIPLAFLLINFSAIY